MPDGEYELLSQRVIFPSKTILCKTEGWRDESKEERKNSKKMHDEGIYFLNPFVPLIIYPG